MMHGTSAAGANESTGAIERSHGALRRAAAIALCRAALENQHGCISVLGEELLPLRSVLPSTLLRKPLLTVGASVAFVASTAANGAESC
jgi:hypothetical protein